MTCMLLASAAASAQNDIKDNEFNPVNTGVTTLSIAPDARGSSMGNLGVATDPDMNSQFWNPSKYAFGYSNGGLSLSYTPWLRKIVNDIFLANLAGYWKPGSGDNQAFSASLRYFSLGEVTTSGYDGEGNAQTINPYEFAIDLGYSRKLSESSRWEWCLDIFCRIFHTMTPRQESPTLLHPHSPWICRAITPLTR